MEYIDIGQFIFALAVVAALIYGAGWFMRHSGMEKRVLRKASPGGRLKVVDSLFIDPRHRLVVVRQDDVEHTLILSANEPVVVESGVEVSASGSHSRRSEANDNAKTAA